MNTYAAFFNPLSKGKTMFARRLLVGLVFVAACSACSIEDSTSVKPDEAMRPQLAVTGTDSVKGRTFIGADGGTLVYDVYWSKTAPSANAHSIVWVAGGGWTNVGVDSPPSDFYPPRLAKQINGYVFMPRYRVGYGIWPAQEYDARCMVRFLRYNATSMGLDRLKIDGVGHSAGGHLIGKIARDAEPALTCYQGTSSGLRRAATLAAPSDVVALSEFNVDAAAFIPKVFGDSIARRLASPALTGGPCVPLLVIHGKKDTSIKYAQAIKLANACAPWGSQLMLVDAGTHGMTGTYKTTVLSRMVSFLTAP